MVKLAVTALILLAIAWKLDFTATLRLLVSVSHYAILLAIFVVLMQSLASANRLAMVVVLFGHRFRMIDAYRVTIESMFFSQTFVSVLGGDAFRIWRICRMGLTLNQATSSVVLDRLIGISVSHLCVLAAFPWLLSVMPPGPIQLALTILAVAGLAGVGLVLALGFVPESVVVRRSLPAAIRDSKPIAVVFNASMVGRHVLAHWHRLAPAALLSLLIVAGNCLIFFLILVDMGANVSTALWCALLAPAVLEIAMLPISIAGWGVREATAIAAFGTFGISAGNALGSSLAFGLILMAVGLIGGFVWLFDRDKIPRGVPSVSEEAIRPAKLASSKPRSGIPLR